MGFSSVAMSRTGRWVAVSRSGFVELVDLLGASASRVVPVHGAIAFVGQELWVLAGHVLHRYRASDLKKLEPEIILPAGSRSIVAGHGASPVDAAVVGDATCRLRQQGETWLVHEMTLDGGDQVVAIDGHRTLISRRGALRMIDRNGGELWHAKLASADQLDAVTMLFGGRAIAVLASGSTDHCSVLQATGKLIHQIKVPKVVQWAVAEEIGHAFALDSEGQLSRIELRYGRIAEVVTPPIRVRELVVDQDGRHLVLAEDGAPDNRVVHLVVSDLFRAGHKIRPRLDDGDEAEQRTGLDTISNGVAVHAEPVDASASPPIEVPPPPPEPQVPDALPLALGNPPPAQPQLEPGESPYLSAREHLDALLDVVASRTALAIADAWNSGRLSHRDKTHRPYELEVGALLGSGGGFAPDQIADTKQQVETRQREASARAQASAARGIALPFPELASEVGLSTVGAQVLLLVAAPALRGEITRLYGVLSNDPHRPIVDRFLIEQIMAGGKSTLRDQIARELAPDSQLVRHGLVRVDSSAASSLFASLSVPDALLDRLRGMPPARRDDVTFVRCERELSQLHIPADTKRKLVLMLAQPQPDDAPLRLVVRGRRASGRHSVIAALAARVSRQVAAIDLGRMPRAAKELVAALRNALFSASVHRAIPMLSGLEQIDVQDLNLRELIRQVLRMHPGPLVVRTMPEATLPLDPGFESITLPPLSETERGDVWRSLLAEAGLRADADALAARFRIGPGVIVRVIQRMGARDGTPGDDVTAELQDQVRQHVATRLDHLAHRLTRLAGWEDIALPDELLDSVREFIARARHRRTVYEQWGYDSKLSTSRGLTALFYGPPGTGKTMVAGVIARELGLDVYRVDLARVVSKWVGETEKNLGEVFDAAEDGQVLILFDEADSLFAKRTDVKTSNDRYANLEVNYLLQRLDSFEGVAILTSNLEGAIDAAFKRRLSLRMQFPFPDEEMRVRLWAAHVTPQTPTVGDFDFGELARRFPLSGGYIRNCVVRAVFLAAHEGRPLAQAHLLRAIQLEYRELGNLSISGRME